MKALLAVFRRAPARPHNDLLRANRFEEPARFSPYIAMLPRL
jgi:hypothetical protein